MRQVAVDRALEDVLKIGQWVSTRDITCKVNDLAKRIRRNDFVSDSQITAALVRGLQEEWISKRAVRAGAIEYQLCGKRPEREDGPHRRDIANGTAYSFRKRKLQKEKEGALV